MHLKILITKGVSAFKGDGVFLRGMGIGVPIVLLPYSYNHMFTNGFIKCNNSCIPFSFAINLLIELREQLIE